MSVGIHPILLLLFLISLRCNVMASWSRLFITESGQSLLAGAVAGQTLSFTRAAAGSGSLGPSELVFQVTSLKEELVSADSLSVSVSGREVVVEAGFSSSVFNGVSFHFREIGIFAKLDDGGEFLLAYGNSGDTADWVEGTGSSGIEKVFRISLYLTTEAGI